MKGFAPRVLLTHYAEPVLVFGYRSASHMHYAVTVADDAVTVTSLDTLRDLRKATWHGQDYPPACAAYYWLHKSRRRVTKRAKAVLRAIINRSKAPNPVADMC